MTEHRILAILIVSAMALCGSASFSAAYADSDPSSLETISVTIPIGTYEIQRAENGYDISVEGYGRLLVPGKPNLPSKIFSVAIPPGARMVELNYEIGQAVVLPGTYDVRPARLPRVIGDEDPSVYQRDIMRYEENLESVYDKDDPYPEAAVEFVRAAGFREYNLVDLRVTPFAYNPLSGRLTYFPEISVQLSYELASDAAAQDRVAGGGVRTERIAQKIILNHDQARGWYSGSVGGRGLHDYVIITVEALVSSVAPLVDWETAKGRTVEVVTTDWITAGYDGYDLAERIRNFLRDKYGSDQWGIEDVLLVGHYDNVPMRRCWQDVGYGKPETDFYYAELSLPDSMSWDFDRNHRWGEFSDPVDFYPEVRVGRIPWSDPAYVLSICEKSVAFEQNMDASYKRNILLLGAYFWANTDNAVLMEAKVDQPWMSDWTITRMYEQNIDYWSTYDCDYPLSHSNAMSIWPTGHYAFVNWAGHGSPSSTHIYGLGAPAFVSNADCDNLDDDYPAIIFADACSNSDTDYLNIGQAMMRRGAVAFVGATKVAYGCPGWSGPYDGSSQSLDYFFTTCVTSGDYTVGEAHQFALWEMYTQGLWDDVRYEAFEWGSLWGNPSLGMASALMTIRLPEGAPELAEPDNPITIPVRITEGLDVYIPGSAFVHYRYDGGDYLALPLVSMGGDQFEATLPPVECGDWPQFYFSAEAQSAGVVLEPADAPSSTYSCAVGELVVLFHDDFENDRGWTVENDATLTGGQWDRGVPQGLGERGDPPADFDGSGACYLTGNEYGDSDVDNGMTALVSPVFDLLGQYVRVSYARWYSNTFGNAPNQDVLEVEVSSNGGVDWTDVEIVGPISQASGGWFEYSFWLNDVIEPSTQVMFRFEASDVDPGSVVEAGVDKFTIGVLECQGPYICGDTDASGGVDIDDAVYLISYILAGGPEPMPYDSGDVDCSGGVDIDDAVFLISYILAGGSSPCDTDGDGQPDC